MCEPDGTFAACVCTSADGGLPPDGGSADAGTDAGQGDAGSGDGGTRDGGTTDAGSDGGMKRPIGAACAQPADCSSGHCVVSLDGGAMCCDQGCGGCLACRASGVGCVAQPSGADLLDECPRDFSTCRSGVCDGDGGCAPAPRDSHCFESCTASQCFGQCSTTTLTYSVCDGTSVGSCPTATLMSSCPGQLSCSSNGGCLTSCRIDAECSQGTYCDGGACVARLPNGQPCTAHHMCTSRLCAGWGGFPVCSECITTDDCRMSASVCTNGRCTGCTSNPDCTGWGQGLCTFSGAGNYCAQCLTNNTAGCGRARAPLCTQGACGCGLNDGVCPTGQLCTGFNPTDVCKWRRGEACIQAGDCASGFCDAGSCE